MLIVTGLMVMTKSFLPYLLKRPEAHLVNLSSMGGFLPVPGQTIYGASKAAVKLFTEGLHSELMDTNVHVHTGFSRSHKDEYNGELGPYDPGTGRQTRF